MKDVYERKGRFIVSFDFIENDNLSFNEKLNVFKDVIILDTRTSYIERKIEYLGISEHFDEVQEGHLIPEYVCILNKDNIGKLTSLEWRRVDAN